MTLSTFVLVGTIISHDSFLSTVEFNLNPATNGGPTIKGLEQIDAWIGKKKWDVIHFNWGLHDLKYMGPNGENLFPKETLFTIEVKKSEILESLDRATVVAEGFIPVKIVLSDSETLNITTVNKDIGGGNEEVSIKTLGVDVEDVSGFEMSFNPTYFMQGIEVLDGDTVYIRFSGNEKPVVIQGDVENYKYLLMPVRT